MRIQKQLYRHDPENSVWGDCHRTCLAMLLDMDAREVPHIAHGDPRDWRVRESEFLAEQGLGIFTVGFQCNLEAVLHYMLHANPGIFYILGGTSKNGTGHSVIGFNDAIVADPSIDDSGIVGPMEDGCYWISILVPGRVVNRLNLPKPDLSYQGLAEELAE